MASHVSTEKGPMIDTALVALQEGCLQNHDIVICPSLLVCVVLLFYSGHVEGL